MLWMKWLIVSKKYLAFERCRRQKGQAVQEFLTTWENVYAKVKVAGCEMSDQVSRLQIATCGGLG